jgi:CheY-like chemotaxis protein
MTGNATCQVLVAEDDALFAATVDDYLTEQGYSVTVSPDGQAALETAGRIKIAALLTDLRMPRLDGRALVRRLRAIRPTLPVVVMTGYAPSDWRTTLHHEGEGPLVLLDKPIRLDNLLGALKEVLAGRACDSASGPASPPN